MSSGEIFASLLAQERDFPHFSCGTRENITMGVLCECGCGRVVSKKGFFRKDCLPEGKVNPTLESTARMNTRRKEVLEAAEKLNYEYPALTKEQIKIATSKALISFNEKYLQFRKKNEGKEIAVSIAVVGEGMHTCGLLSGKSIVSEMKTASITNRKKNIMGNLVRLVSHKGVSYFEIPTEKEADALGAPGELLFDAKSNMQLALFVEKAMQVQVLYREYFTEEMIRLLQHTAGHGTLKQGPPYKVGYRFFLVEKIKSLGFSFKANLSNKQLSFPPLPKGILDAVAFEECGDLVDTDEEEENSKQPRKFIRLAFGVSDYKNDEDDIESGKDGCDEVVLLKDKSDKVSARPFLRPNTAQRDRADGSDGGTNSKRAKSALVKLQLPELGRKQSSLFSFFGRGPLNENKTAPPFGLGTSDDDKMAPPFHRSPKGFCNDDKTEPPSSEGTDFTEDDTSDDVLNDANDASNDRRHSLKRVRKEPKWYGGPRGGYTTDDDDK